MLLHEQLKQRRLALGLQQGDLKARIGMNQQQYQRVEANGNPRLDTLAQIAGALDATLLLVPKEREAAVLALLSDDAPRPSPAAALHEDPWAGLLGQHAG